MKRFWQNNKKQIVWILIIIGLSCLCTYFLKGVMEWVSIMLALPAFSMSFIVLNQFNLGSDLTKAVESELENKRIKKASIKDFRKIIDEELGDVKSSLRNIEKYYGIQNEESTSKTQIQSVLLKNAKEALEKYKKFQQKTFNFIRDRVASKEEISNKTAIENPFPLTLQELSNLENESNCIDNNYFKELSEESGAQFKSSIEKEKKNRLKLFFIDTNCLSSRYIRLVEQIYASIDESED